MPDQPPMQESQHSVGVQKATVVGISRLHTEADLEGLQGEQERCSCTECQVNLMITFVIDDWSAMLVVVPVEIIEDVRGTEAKQ